MDDLAGFLRARYSERRAVAEAASPWPWAVNPEDSEQVLASDDVLVADVFALSGNQTRNTATFIAVNDPGDVLADLDAKLAAVDHHERVQAHADVEQRQEYLLAAGACRTALRILARPFAGHPDYREEWRPTP